LKKTILILSIIGAVVIISFGLNEMIGQKITIQKRTGEENIFHDYKEVTKRKHVSRAIKIVKNANWENEKEMKRYADYQFQFPSKNRKGDDKIASYLLWISPNSENVEIVTDSKKYVKLAKQDAADLYEIITGEALIK